MKQKQASQKHTSQLPISDWFRVSCYPFKEKLKISAELDNLIYEAIRAQGFEGTNRARNIIEYEARKIL
jgi:hypothetical protein